jgi:hypothetical protein
VFNKSKLFGSIGALTASLTLLVLPGCTGKLLGGGEEGAMGPGSNGAAGSSTGPNGSAGGSVGNIAALDCSQHVIDPGPSPMRLLTREQYLATVRDLAGDVPGLDEIIDSGGEASAFGLVQPDVTQVELEHFQSAAASVAKAIVSDAASLDKVAPCASGAAPADCTKNAVQTFGTRAYRAPVTDAADIDRHVQLFNVGAATSYQFGIELLLRGMLQSPRFLYRVEIGTGEKVSEKAVKLSPHEIAARLSYRVWGTMPDQGLNDAIAAGTLSTKEGVAAQLTRMLADPRGQKLVNHFLESWTHIAKVDGLVKSPELYPEFQEPTFKTGLKDQATAFFADVLSNRGGKLNALLTTQNDVTAAGLLALPAIMAITGKPDESSPIYRGLFVREALLCQQLPSPPANVPPAPEVDPTSSTRDRANQHNADPACSGCHRLLDPLGFGFENYDTIGRYRTTDGGKPIDASGNLASTRDIDGPFNGVAELATRLASSAEVEECVTRQWFRFAIERFEQESDGCSLKAVLDGFKGSGQDLNTLPQAVVGTDAYLYRRPLDAQVQP